MQLVGHCTARRQVRERNLVGGRDNQHIGLAAVVVSCLHGTVDFSKRQRSICSSHVGNVGAVSGRCGRCAFNNEIRQVRQNLAGLARVGSRLGFIFEQRLIDVAALLDSF